MRKLFFIIFLAMVVSSCVTTYKPKCRHNSIYAAIIVGEKHPVRIVSGPSTTTRGVWHSQAQVFKNGSWHWLKVTRSSIIETTQDRFIPEKYRTIQRYMKAQRLYGRHQQK